MSRSLMSSICYPLQATQATGNNLCCYHVTPQLPQRIPPRPLQNSLHQEPNASNKAFLLPMQTLPDQILPAPPPTISHQYSKTPHQTFPQAAKMETAGEETRPSNKLTDSAMPQEIISFLRFIKSFV